MSRRLAAVLALAAPVCVLACQSIAGLGDFHPRGDQGAGASGQGGDGEGGRTGTGGDGGDGGDGVTSGGGSPGPTTTTTTTTTTSSIASTSSTGGGCTLDHLVISEVRTRGPDDGNQDFIEIFNPTGSTVTLTSAFRVDARGESAGTYATRWTGDGSIVLEPGTHALLANDAGDNPLGGATPDGFYQSGIPDGASVVLYEDATVLDAVCFTCEAGSLARDFVCEGAPFARPASCSSAGDSSVQRRAEGSAAGCADSDDNAADLEEATSTPQGGG